MDVISKIKEINQTNQTNQINEIDEIISCLCTNVPILFVADEKDQPIEGELLLHSKSRDEVYEAQKDLKDDLYITYSGELPKEGFAVAFYG